VGVYRDCPNFFSTPIISGTAKATNFKFCTHILNIDRNKSPLPISGKVAGCVVRTLKTFQGTHILGASRGLLGDNSAVLLLIIIGWGESGKVILQVSTTVFRTLSKYISGKDGSAP